MMEILNGPTTQSRQITYGQMSSWTSIAIENAFKDCNECRPHSSIDYLPIGGFKKKFLDDPVFRERFWKKEVEVTLDEN